MTDFAKVKALLDEAAEAMDGKATKTKTGSKNPLRYRLFVGLPIDEPKSNRGPS
jgi:hypothetical protein